MMKKNNQKGAAAIWYVFVMGVMMSFGALGIEGARYITKKARLGDGLEAAAIAVSTADRVNQDFSLNRVKPVAENWVKHYINDSTKLELNIKRKDENKVNKDNMLTPYDVSYFRYDVTAKTKHKSWFNFNSWASFDPDVVVANTGTSGRIKGGHEPVDLVFVADFSGSMRESSNGKNKLASLKAAIENVSNAIYKANDKSTFGFIPFSKRIVVKRNGKYYCTSPLLPPSRYPYLKPRTNKSFSSLMKLPYNSYYGMHSRSEFYKDNQYTIEEEAISERYISWMKGDNNYKTNNGRKIDQNNYDQIRYYNRQEINPVLRFNEHIDFKRTAENITVENKPMYPTSVEYDSDYYNTEYKDGKPKFSGYCTNWDIQTKAPYYYSLSRKNNLSSSELKGFISKLKTMTAGGGTDMYQGLLAAPDEFYGAVNKNRYIIVLSDGEENNDNFKYLVDNKLCQNINYKLKEPGDGNKYNFKMFVVGIGFDPKNATYNSCFGKDNIIPVYDMGSLTDKILGLITDDIGHNFDRYNKKSNITPIGR